MARVSVLRPQHVSPDPVEQSLEQQQASRFYLLLKELETSFSVGKEGLLPEV